MCPNSSEFPGVSPFLLPTSHVGGSLPSANRHPPRLRALSRFVQDTSLTPGLCSYNFVFEEKSPRRMHLLLTSEMADPAKTESE